MEKSMKIFQRRKATLKKKAGELAALCKCEVCVVCYEPNGEVDVWPQDPTKAQSIINHYYYTQSSLSTKKKRGNNKLNLSNVLENKMKKLEEQVKVNHSTTILPNNSLGLWDEQLDTLSNQSLVDLSQCLEAKIHTLDQKIELLNQDKHFDKELNYNLPPVLLPQDYVQASLPSANYANNNVALHQVCVPYD